MAEHNELGKEGEDIAADYLEKKGYEILRRNYRFLKSELDIVAKCGNQLVVVEVKTRASRFMAGPEQTVTMKKQREIIRAANAFIEEYKIAYETRFDIISIILNSQEQEIEHLEDAFYPVL